MPTVANQLYYDILPREGLISGAVAYVDGQPAGFIVATPDSARFMRIALRSHWWRIWVIGISVLREPKRLAAIWEAEQIMRSRTGGNSRRTAFFWGAARLPPCQIYQRIWFKNFPGSFPPGCSPDSRTRS